MMCVRAVGSALAVTVSLGTAGPALGRRLPGTPVPRGFVGMNVDGPMLTLGGRVARPSQFKAMRGHGVQSVRVPFSWASAQPYANWSEVPASQKGKFVSGAGGVPTSFAGTDQIVALAAAQRMPVLPIVIYAPSWDALPGTGGTGSGLSRPAADGPYGAYLTTLVERYGPHGSFWRHHPRIRKQPIRMWEIWNQPFADSYLTLLGVAHAAIKRADRHAQVVLAGVPNFSWQLLDTIYRIHGARRLFDIVDIHPYTQSPDGVIEILERARAIMRKHGNPHKPIIAGETGWPSSLGRTPPMFAFGTTAAGQARDARELLSLLAANRRRLGLADFYWYTWMGDVYPGAFAFNYSGLLDYHNGNVFAKPALSAFSHEAHAIEG
jgi:hypothetical protein